MTDFRIGDYQFSRRQRNFTSAIGFLMIGLGLGALATLLVTPKTGRQVRKEVRRRYEDARDVVGNWTDRASDMWDKRDEWAEAAREKAEPVARRFRRG
ncbi:MAG TPA: YtxH domain-containing protein [Candidatus Saccharimonadales bacterium]|nr:YtxH domain-containing protein [Candidatus Saccharimonadales bacterium]